MNLTTEELKKSPYNIKGWSENYFDVNDQGHVVAQPDKIGSQCDLYSLTQSLIQRGIEPPILIRFQGIIRDRIASIYQAFEEAIQTYDYRSSYRLAFPIKVNQQRHVVETIQQAGKDKFLSLEVGSKPELLAVLSIPFSPGSLLLCNGYKDAEYIELALLSQKLGRRAIIIVEQLQELPLILAIANQLNVEAEIGFRMKPTSQGSGKWASSGGNLAKFGLSTDEMIHALDQLKATNKTSWVKLLHFHIGSQITEILAVKKALREASHMYTVLAECCPSLTFFDVGGGLAVDYLGSRVSHDSSMNYSVEEYARDVVYAIGEACRKAEVDDPIIISESGRALVAHHSVLVTQVIDSTTRTNVPDSIQPPCSENEITKNLYLLFHNIDQNNFQECLHDALELNERIVEEFIQGNLTLRERAYAERTCRYIKVKIRHVATQAQNILEEVKQLDHNLTDTYFCNFSVFQSLLDSWAIEQVFPVVPLHRLHEEPTKRSIIADLTCDSDGQISQFPNGQQPRDHIYLHEFDGKPYYLGIFLVGAYQETLGNLHNLFGNTNIIQVDLDENNQWEITHYIEGHTIKDVLHSVQYKPNDFIESLRLHIEKSLKSGLLDHQEAAKLRKKFKQALDSYTYLVA